LEKTDHQDPQVPLDLEVTGENVAQLDQLDLQDLQEIWDHLDLVEKKESEVNKVLWDRQGLLVAVGLQVLPEMQENLGHLDPLVHQDLEVLLDPLETQDPQAVRENLDHRVLLDLVVTVDLQELLDLEDQWEQLEM